MNALINSTAVINNQAVSIVDYKGMPVVTTAMLAEFYGTEPVRIRQNHSENKNRFEEGKHFHKIERQDLNDFVSSFKLLANQFDISPKARALTLWTERGAMRHAKLLETDQAWQVFEQLEETYFRGTQPKQVVLPNFLDPAESAIAWAEQYKFRQAAEQQLSITEPKATALDRISDTTSLFTVRQTAKIIKLKERELVNELLRRGWVYRDKRDALQPYAGKIAAGYVTTVMTAPIKQASGEERVFSQLRITTKGVTRLGYLAAKGVAA